MFFVLLQADHYAGILEADGGFELFPINGPPQLQRFPRLLFAGCRYARRRSSASKGKLQKACNDHGSAHNDHIGGSWRHQAENQRQKAQRQQEHAINATAHRPLFARRAFRSVSSDEVYRIPHNGAVPPTLSFQMPVQQFRSFSVHSGIIVLWSSFFVTLRAKNPIMTMPLFQMASCCFSCFKGGFIVIV